VRSAAAFLADFGGERPRVDRESGAIPGLSLLLCDFWWAFVIAQAAVPAAVGCSEFVVLVTEGTGRLIRTALETLRRMPRDKTTPRSGHGRQLPRKSTSCCSCFCPLARCPRNKHVTPLTDTTAVYSRIYAPCQRCLTRNLRLTKKRKNKGGQTVAAREPNLHNAYIERLCFTFMLCV